MAGVLVLIYLFFSILRSSALRRSATPWLAISLYGIIALFTMFITWPYLWENPVAHFFDVFRLMSDNPTNLSVLFGGEIYRAGELPRRYLPFMLGATFTEPVWILFICGVLLGYVKMFRDTSPQRGGRLMTATLTLSWFLLLVLYVLIRKPSMYDGMRHFLFIVPPVFVFSGFTFSWNVSQFHMARGATSKHFIRAISSLWRMNRKTRWP